MKKNIVYIGLGSNLDDPRQQIKRAIEALAKVDGIDTIKDSGYFASRPMGPEDQPDYINAVVEIETGLTAEELLLQCQSIEQQQGRIKTRYWGERSIDLDILLFADQQIAIDDLTVPHPGICERDFVYMPLLTIDPAIDIPGKGSLADIINAKNINSDDHGCHFVGKIE